MIEHITVSSSSRDDRDLWVELLNDQICVCQMASTTTSACPSQTKTLPTFRNTMQDNLLLNNPSSSLASALRNSMQNQKSSLGSPDFTNPELKSPTLHPVIPPHVSYPSNNSFRMCYFLYIFDIARQSRGSCFCSSIRGYL